MNGLMLIWLVFGGSALIAAIFFMIMFKDKDKDKDR